jgi:chorismate dehydratase
MPVDAEFQEMPQWHTNWLSRLRVCAVSFLNTCPLVWGLQHGPQKDIFDLSFEIPSVCADRLADGSADIGLVPVIEAKRQGLEFVPGLGIACNGPVRSILLISHVPAPEIRSLAVDCSSRTSVALAEVVLRERFGVAPRMIPHGPQLDLMLQNVDAGLLIGDPALRLHPDELPYHVYDLGQEWKWMTGLPMVFAVWAARPNVIDPAVVSTLRASSDFGSAKIEEIIAVESVRRGFSPELVRQYLTHYIHFELTADFERGMERFLNSAS